MDIATIGGLIVGLLFVVGGISLNGSLMAFVDIPGACIVFGGACASLLVAFPLRQVLGAIAIAKQCFLVRVPEAHEELRRFTELATVARRDGLLGLEAGMDNVKDRFLRRGLELVIDNTPAEKLEDALNTELACIQERHSMGKKIFEQMGALLPAMGMVGTLIGLIQMLGKLDDPSKIGAGMAVAMITTFYGAVGANLIFLPLANKLEMRSKEEVNVRGLMIQGLIALLEGDGPRVVEAKLIAFLAPKLHPNKQAEAA